MTTPVTFGSLFSGIGGLDRGVELATGWTCAWQVEADPFCRAVLAKHWPNVTRFEDVRNVGASTLAPVDVIVGGFPCQNVSLAGRGEGLHGDRSGLWFEMLRIIREVRPRGVLVENVPGLVRRGLDEVVAGLAGEGYAVEATNLGAEDVGAPHWRRRLFLVAYAVRAELRKQPGGARRGPDAQARLSLDRLVVADAMRSRCEGSGPRTLAGRDGPSDDSRRDQQAQSDVGRGAHGLPVELDGHRWPNPPGPQAEGEPVRTVSGPAPNRRARLKALGNAVVPHCAAIAARRLADRMGA